ncbi:hypothetical protein AB0L70_06880 [Kribbella sp. NPDC051952]|uniref:hypothetical protein n=1 Tax=Kribbella sp. NPDC051952 TaxID=3154851 RepID=UPI0034363C5D
MIDDLVTPDAERRDDAVEIVVAEWSVAERRGSAERQRVLVASDLDQAGRAFLYDDVRGVRRAAVLQPG